MRRLASLCKITEIEENIIHRSLCRETRDFEDCVQYESALLHQVDVIITRNVKDFKDFVGNVQTPNEFLAAYFDKQM